MDYQKFQPCKTLEPFVECYYSWQSGNVPVVDLVVESPPTGFCSFVFNNGDTYFLQNKKYDKLEVPQNFVAGQSIYSYKLFLNGIISIAGIVFKPAGIATLYELPMHAYTEERVDLKTIFAPSLIQKYAERIANESASKQKALIL